MLDLRDPAEPKYRVVIPGDDLDLDSPEADITEATLGGTFDGASYPYRVEGIPVLHPGC